MNVTLDEVMALGFESVKQCSEHQEWLIDQSNERNKAREAVELAERTKTNVIDIR